MKKTYVLSMAIGAMLVCGCTKEPQSAIEQKPMVNEKDYNAVAKVSSPEVIAAILENSNGSLTRAGLASQVAFDDNFVSLMDVSEVQENVPVTYYEKFEYETLVPNTDLASLLNTKGEIQVGDFIYRITDAGTYAYDPDLRGQVDEMIEQWDQAQGETIADFTVQLADGITRYNTFEEAKQVVEVEDYSFYAADPNWDNDAYWEELENNVGKEAMSRAHNYVMLPPDYPVYEAGRNWWGNNKTYHVYFNKKRRVNGQLYAHNYRFYTETGAHAKLQKKQWIGWHRTRADEMRIICSDIITELQLPTPDPRIPAPGYKQPQYLGYYRFYTPDGRANKVIVLGGIDVEGNAFKEAVKKGFNAIPSYLSKAVGFSLVDKNNPANFLLINGRKAHSITAMVARNAYSVETLNCVFSSNLEFEINIPSQPGSAYDWFKSVSGKASSLNLRSAKCLIDARLGHEWKGMILTKSL